MAKSIYTPEAPAAIGPYSQALFQEISFSHQVRLLSIPQQATLRQRILSVRQSRL